MKISLIFNITFFLVLLFNGENLTGKDNLRPRPTEKELETASKEFGRKGGIPAELKGVWTTEKMLVDPDTGPNGRYIIESFTFCEKDLIQRRATIFDGAKPPRNVSNYSILTEYNKGRDKNQHIFFITLKAVPDFPEYATYNWLTYYPATKQLKFNHYVHKTLLYSRNYVYSKCPSDKK